MTPYMQFRSARETFYNLPLQPSWFDGWASMALGNLSKLKIALNNLIDGWIKYLINGWINIAFNGLNKGRDVI